MEERAGDTLSSRTPVPHALGLRRFLPFLRWLPTVTVATLTADLIAGITVAAYVIPEALAYAGLVGVPVRYGLYALLLPAAAYAIFGTSKQIGVSPTAAISSLTAIVLAPLLLRHDPGRHVALALTLTLLVGVFCLAAGALRLGFVAAFVSAPVVSGFITGAALYIASTQLGPLFGIDVPHGVFYRRIGYLVGRLGETHLPTLLFGLGCVATLLVVKRRAPRWPGPLIVVVGSIVLVRFTPLGDLGLAQVGDIKAGLPSLAPPAIDLADVRELAAGAAAVALVAFVEHIGAARSFAARHRYRVDANQELLGLGAANLAGAFTQSLPTGGNMSRTAVNDGAGATSQLSSLVTGLTVAAVLIALTGVFAWLPGATLSAIVVVAAGGLAEFPALRRIRALDRTEFVFALIALVGVLVVGMLYGILIAAAANLLWFLLRASRLSAAQVGRVPDVPGVYADLTHDPRNRPVDGVLIYRIEGPLWFANAHAIEDEVKALAADPRHPTHAVVLDLARCPSVDVTSCAMIADLQRGLAGHHVALTIASPRRGVRDTLRRADLLRPLGADDDEAALRLRTIDVAVRSLASPHHP